MVRLIFVNDEGTAEVDLPHDGAVFGRALENELPVMADSISGIHGQIRWTGGRWVLTDLGSTNGTFVNGRRVQQSPLSDGDMLQFGFVAAQVRVVPSLVKPADAPPDPKMAILIIGRARACGAWPRASRGAPGGVRRAAGGRPPARCRAWPSRP